MDKVTFQNKSYRTIIGELERLETDGAYKGNGHHLAQRLCNILCEEFKDEI